MDSKNLIGPEADKRREVAMDGVRPDDRDGKHFRHLFDEFGHLTPQRHTQIRDRLNTTGYWSAMRQSELLAQRLGHADQSEIWALLMWNARPGKALAAKLHWWLAAGMPLTDGAATQPHPVPLARAS